MLPFVSLEARSPASELQGRLGKWDRPEKMALMVPLARLARLAHKVLSDQRECRVSQERLVRRAQSALQDQLVLRESKVHKGLRQ
jgi:hypothetical protein